MKVDLGSSSAGSSKVSPSNVTCVSSEVKLPQIQLPTFSGNYEEWQSFHDMFVSLIDRNPSLSQVQKLHYLKCSLKGEPENLLRSLSTTDTNYEEAWDRLKRRYNNKRFNVNEILKRLFGQKPMSSESATAIKHLIDTTEACLKALKNLDIDVSSWDAIINFLIVSKLDLESRRQWETEAGRSQTDSIPKWSELVTFLESRFRTLEMLVCEYKQNMKVNNINPKQTRQKSFHIIQDNKKDTYKENNKVCVCCSDAHLLYQCKQFGGKSPEERYEFIQAKRLCFNCFSSNHNVRSCHQSTCCRRCGRRHHTLLHIERDPPPVSGEPCTSKGHQPTSLDENRHYDKKVVAHFAKDTHQTKVLLATALARIKSANGCIQIARILIDQGSEASFITESTVQYLCLKRTPINGLITGVGDGKLRSKHIVSFELESLHNHEFSVSVNAFVLPSLSSFLPSSKVSIFDWPELSSLPLADPKYGSPGKIDIILGVDIFSQIMLSGFLKHPIHDGPIAQNTHLGWILSGRIGENEESNPRVVNLHLQVREDNILTQFWEIEREPDLIGKKLTKEEIRCEEIYESTTTRNEEGRYVVRLPFKEPDPKCVYGNSKEVALKRFKVLERKFKKNSDLHAEYEKVIVDYQNQKHMKPILSKEDIEYPFSFYLPHHAVIREDKETTKLRVVFDASCKGNNNISLNDTLLVGPKIQQDLRHIIMRWRTHIYCIVADIVQMYRQIVVHEDDSNFQRILWRADPSQPIQHFKLSRLTFGTACAPYLAVKSLQQLARDEESKYPLAAKITLEDFYMDDLLTGCNSEEEAIDIYTEMNQLMSRGGFKLQKWCSNCPKLLNHIENDNQSSKDTFIFEVNDTIKVLGISWNKNIDKFEYTYNLPELDEPVTKRKVLSDIARLYDPLGWVSPVLITAKIFMQTLWKSGLNWDENLSSELLNQWLHFRKELDGIRGIAVPRWLSTTNDDPVELHVFADASQVAYAAVVYLKTVDTEGNTYVNVVTSKTKVAPIQKEISIPRMELCAALLAAKLISEVAQVLQVPKDKLFAWSDSTIVLAWLRGEPSRWTTFVSNRVSEILTVLDSDQWNHVATDQNPADCASRGMSSGQLVHYDLWWHGPKSLHKNHVYSTHLDVDTDVELRPLKVLTNTTRSDEEFIWERFSNLTRMLRVLSYCRKFLKLREPKELRDVNKRITTNEMNAILDIIVKATQRLYFEDEINKLMSRTGSVTKGSPLHTLAPFLDEKGLLRVGGRIQRSSVQFNKKHPLIMPSESHLTRLLILDAHHRTLHGGPQLMINFLRNKFWILRLREKVKKCYRECMTCLRYSRQDNNQLMGQLPKVRLTPDKPFRSSGVDFTGYIDIRFSPGRGSKSYKGYICLFVCMATKAIHLEAVSDLTSSGFIAAFKRFVSRRGHCRDLYSDNGTNFVGADKELRKMLCQAKSELADEIANLLTQDGTTWHFIPPHAPNFGGLWEAGVRSVKTHLKRIIGYAILTFEELTTVLTQVEACLNSRPISAISDNPDDEMPLTPGHFLVGEPLVLIPESDYSKTSLTGLQRWKLTQRMVSNFWKTWSKEYLVTLNNRYKWFSKKTEPDVDDIVIIRDHNIPPAKWLLGKIVEKHPGKDNLTRVVTIKTKNGLCKRPCNKLCILPKA
ncbi:uncharacterized protein LOC123694566 [Colias croceus]|uniref:uncharacterized protein LOC123694566 n=1 Tax=Colias crocea TaxID=72248 RepID=UPI001E280133|nr:uncharacterized protein LOC123694566 [Colias croceus]